MQANDQIRAVLRSLSLPLPVVDIEVEDHVDAAGENSLRVSVILDEQVRDESLSGPAVVRLKVAIREALLQHGVNEFPYVFLTKASERAAVDAEE